MIVTPPMPVKTATYLEPAAPRRRPGRAVTALSTRRALRAAPAPSTIGSIVVAERDDERCEHRSGSLRCVRGSHLDSPQAHVLVAGAPDPDHVRTPGAAPAASVPVAACCA